MEDKGKVFSYAYSAKQQEEINQIRQKYDAPKEDKMEQLRRLDRSVENPPMIKALSTGILGALIMGAGMSGVMVGTAAMFVPGIIVGVVGLAVASVAYPLYLKVLKKNREKKAPQIMALLNEIAEGKNS